MAGLFNGLLPAIFSAGNTAKRKVNALMSDPLGEIGAGVANVGEEQNQLLNLFRNAYPMAGNRTVLNSPQQIDSFRRELADKGTEQAMAAATVWHGSPHKFDKFDASKIGTGEGAQAYGHGLYLAESPDVAGQYAKNIMGPTATPENIALKVINATGDESVAVQRLKQIYPKMTDSEIGAAITNAKGYQGNTYKVDLPDEHIAKMLDWDKPLSQQHPDVQAALSDPQVMTAVSKLKQSGQLGDYSAEDLLKLKGEDWHDILRQANSDRNDAPSEFLKSRGIPGIRFLDGGSRGSSTIYNVGAPRKDFGPYSPFSTMEDAQKQIDLLKKHGFHDVEMKVQKQPQTSNFVVFPGNESMLQILERNGKPLNKLRELLK